mmetsp:Transcript_59492/g.96249  ORF Transcript_59492/g.96249 Transcript_59492/m.96249 type:complete len:95 (-) Transcript_59492:109-393(-)
MPDPQEQTATRSGSDHRNAGRARQEALDRKILPLASVKKDWMRVLLQAKQKKVMQSIVAVMGDSSTNLRCKENAGWILHRMTELSDASKTLFAG